VRYALPQPFEELDHTADMGLAVEGATAEESLARLVLALSATMAGVGLVTASRALELHADPGTFAMMAVDLLREELRHFAVDREIVAEVEVLSFDPSSGARITCRVGSYDAVRHEEGPELEAYKDVSEVVDVVEKAGISHRVARLVPLGVIKG